MHLVNPFIFNKFFLDIFSGAYSAFSFRKLRNGYTGYAIKVGRSSDSTLLDIGFVGENLDTSSLLSFVGSGDGYLKTMYDQTGNSNDLQQSGGDLLIVQSGVLVTENGKPTARYNSATDSYLSEASTNAFLNNKPSATMISVSKKIPSSQGAIFSTVYESSLANARARITYDSVANKISLGGRRLLADSFQQITSTSNYTGNLESIIGVLDYANSDAYLYLNGSLDSSTTSFQTSGNTDAVNSARKWAGRQSPSAIQLNGYISELVLYETSQVSNAAAMYANQKAFYGLP